VSEKKNIIDGQEVAYIVAPSEDLKAWQVVLVSKGVPGYRPIADYPPVVSKVQAEGVAGRLNQRLGVSKEEALLIAVTTMGKEGRRGG
jgi:hypothetical protein